MEWREEGILIAVRPHGESAAIIEVFTEAHGRHAGVVRGGMSRRMAPLLQPGTQVRADWRARLDSHLGTFTVEPVRSRAGLMADRLALAGLMAVCAMLHVALPERDAQPGLYRATMALLGQIEAGIGRGPAVWTADYLRWEMALLADLGFGLDLTRCAITGSREDLAYVSPRTGRAVARDAAGEWAARLLPLPPAALGQGPASPAEVVQGMGLTGHFLSRDALRGDRPLPEARQRLLDLLSRG